MKPFTPDELDAAMRTVRAVLPPTPQQRWPLLDARLGCEAWVKHENHTPVGAFKVRGGLTWFETLRREQPAVRTVVAATRGNHGQSIAFAARRHGLAAIIVVPHGNSVEKNAAMRAWGAELIEHGHDFQEAREHAGRIAAERGACLVPSFHRELVRGVATGWIEFFGATQPDVVYVPIGLGSGLVACAAARARTGARSRIVGVVSTLAPAYLESFRAGFGVERPATTRLADGMACRVPDPDALAMIRAEADDVIAVSDEEVAEAMRALFSDTHNVAEGAGAAALAAALQQREKNAGRSVGLALSGGNVDRALFAEILTSA